MTDPVRIPADVEREDHILAGLTARQVALLAGAGVLLYGLWVGTRALVPVEVFLGVAAPIGIAALVITLGRRDGLSLDRLLIAAIRQWATPRHRVAAPDGVRAAPSWLTPDAPSSRPEQVPLAVLRLPARTVTDPGVVDLGCDGLAMVAVASTVNFALRTAAEQQALVASFGRYLHSLAAPVQLLVRTERLDLSAQIAELRDRAGGLPHPALEAAATEHADYLVQLGEQSDLLRRQVLLVLREPLGIAAAVDGIGGPGLPAVLGSWASRRRTRHGERAGAGAKRAAESRLVRRLGEAVALLSPAGIVVTQLDAGQASAVLVSACNPDSVLPAGADLAGADEVITTAGADPADNSVGGIGGLFGVPPDHGKDHDRDNRRDDVGRETRRS